MCYVPIAIEKFIMVFYLYHRGVNQRKVTRFMVWTKRVRLTPPLTSKLKLYGLKKMSKLIEDLDDETERLARHFLLEAHSAGLSVTVTSTLRTREIQLAYFAQGRATLEVVNLLRKVAGLKPIPKDENLVITKCDGVNTKSKHQEGKAFDVVLLNKYGDPIWHVATVFMDYKKMGEIGESEGLTWGGRFKPIDPATGIGFDPFHFET